jgi:hypothetical protein
VFGGKSLPSQWHGHPVISGDEHDLRFLDPRGGHVIGLKAKGEAKADKSGFVVWDHEGNTEGTQAKDTSANKMARVMAAVKGKAEKSDLGKAKQEQYYSPRGKRIIRDERRASTPVDPIAKPRPELPGAKNPLKKADQSGGWIGKKKEEPKKEEPKEGPKKEKAQAKEPPTLNYAEINKIKAKPASGALDYSKMPPPPPEEPRWKKRAEAKKTNKSEHSVGSLKKQNPTLDSAGVASIKGAFGGGQSTPPPPPPPPSTDTGSLGGNITGAVNRFLGKTDEPHAPGSPEDSAHDVAEEGSSLKGELQRLGTPEKMSQMLAHLRSLKGGQGLRSPANQAAGKDPAPAPNKMAKGVMDTLSGAASAVADALAPGAAMSTSIANARKDIPEGATGGITPQTQGIPKTPVTKSEPEEYANTPGNRKQAKDDYEADMKDAARQANERGDPLGKAAPAPAAPAQPAKGPTIPSALTKPKKPKDLKPKVIMAGHTAVTPAVGVAAKSGGKWPVPGKVPPKMPERPAKPMAKAAPKGVSEKKYESCKEQVAAKQGGSEKKPYNVYAVCAEALKKACDTMRGGKMEKGDVISMKDRKPAAKPAEAPKKEGYDFEAAQKQNAQKKAKQAEEIKNQDVKGKIARNPRR